MDFPCKPEKIPSTQLSSSHITSKGGKYKIKKIPFWQQPRVCANVGGGMSDNNAIVAKSGSKLIDFIIKIHCAESIGTNKYFCLQGTSGIGACADQPYILS